VNNTFKNQKEEWIFKRLHDYYLQGQVKVRCSLQLLRLFQSYTKVMGPKQAFGGKVSKGLLRDGKMEPSALHSEG
jgi:hypothetical protein